MESMGSIFVFREMFRRRSFRQLLKSGVIVISAGTVGFCGLEILYGSEKFYRNCIMSAVQALFDAESAHKLAVKMFANKLIPPFGQNYREYPILQTTVWGIEFRNPVGIAAGFDKDAVALPGLISSGFGFAEIGTVTPLAQEGNTKPRVFRLKEDLAVINSYGFNSEGHEAVFTRLETFLKTLDDFTVKIGVNLGKNKTSPNATEDFVAGVKKFGSFCDYLVINVSSPNTPGLRDLQHKRELENLLTAVNKARSELNHPTVMLLKVSPDLTNEERADIANVCTDKRFNVNGLIVSNTTIARPDSLISSNKVVEGVSFIYSLL